MARNRGSKGRMMASDDLIFPLLPRNTQVSLGGDRDRIRQLQKKQKAKLIAGDDEQDETQHARIEERQQRQSSGEQQAQQEPEQSAQASTHVQPESSEQASSSRKGQHLDIFA